MTVEKVAGSTNEEFPTGRSVDTQPYGTPSSEGSKKLKFTIPMEGRLFATVVLVAGRLSKEMSTRTSVSTNVLSIVAAVEHVKLTDVPT